MRNIVVNKEYTASRCEICHQEDCFDALSNTCQRCKDIRVPITTANSTKKQLDFGEIGLVPQIICYAVVSLVTVYLLLASPPINIFQNQRFNNIFDLIFGLIFIFGLVNCGFLCFAGDKSKNVLGWLQLGAFCFMAFARCFLVKILQSL